MGGVVGKGATPEKASIPETKLEAKMVEAMQQRASEGTALKSFNTIILKFPKIDESLRDCKATFTQFDTDSNGAIDHEELKHCFQNLEISFTEEEFNDLFQACDINKDCGMNFNEFVVLLCLVFLLKDDPVMLRAVSKLSFLFKNRMDVTEDYYRKFHRLDWKARTEMPHLESTFRTLVDAFVFLDKNKDGYVSKGEMVEAINETTSGERSSGRIAMKRFEEMDWDKNGMVNFKEFLFAFTRWVGIDDMEDEDEAEEEEGGREV